MWNGWPLDRAVFLFAGFGFSLVFVQVTMMHYRQNFRHWSQWLPVIALPVLALNAFFLACVNHPTLRNVFAVLAAAGVIEGLFGFYKHFTGVGKRVDGYRFHNFLVGPPIILPLLISALCALGLLALCRPEMIP